MYVSHWSKSHIFGKSETRKTLSSPCSWQWEHKWWRCLCHVSPASSCLLPPVSLRSGPPPYWNQWATSLPSLVQAAQVCQTRRAWWSGPQRAAWGHLGRLKGEWEKGERFKGCVKIREQEREREVSWCLNGWTRPFFPLARACRSDALRTSGLVQFLCGFLPLSTGIKD